MSLKEAVRKTLRKTGFAVVRVKPDLDFRSDHYLRHNARRLEHLASLSIAVAGNKVLEVGAGIGDHSHYYIDRDAQLTITEARPESVDYLRRRYPTTPVHALDLDDPRPVPGGPFDVVHCYGLLYHLRRPETAIAYMANQCGGLLLLETCVSFGSEKQINLVEEDADNPTQAYSGTGCRPTRAWIFAELKTLFPHVYVPRTQPNHAEFPIDWTAPERHRAGLSRAVFVASRTALDNELLSATLLDRQTRHP